MENSHKARIIGGEFKRRILQTPYCNDNSIRPTTDALKEVIFNVIEHRFYINFFNTYTLDVFAGSGALGIEAISRGSQHCISIDKDYKAILCIRENISTLKISDRFDVIHTDISKSFPVKQIEKTLQNKKNILLVFIDPPYANKILIFEVLQNLKQLNMEMLVIIESDDKFKFSSEKNQDNEKILTKYKGKSSVTFLHYDKNFNFC